MVVVVCRVAVVKFSPHMDPARAPCEVWYFKHKMAAMSKMAAVYKMAAAATYLS
jgi:hypothetical protein